MLCLGLTWKWLGPGLNLLARERCLTVAGLGCADGAGRDTPPAPTREKGGLAKSEVNSHNPHGDVRET